MPRRIEVLREVWRVLERREGAIFRTAFVERGWFPLDEVDAGRPHNDPDLLWVSVPEDVQTIRSVKVER